MELKIRSATAAKLKAAYSIATSMTQESVADVVAGKGPLDDEKNFNASYLRYLLGRALIDLREQMGENSLKLALAESCPSIPWDEAERIMNTALDNCVTSEASAVLDAANLSAQNILASALEDLASARSRWKEVEDEDWWKKDGT